jgi:tetratricopeptide (TPR) repeat protein
MKKILVTVVLGVAVLAAAKDAVPPQAQTANPQPSATPAQPAAQPSQTQAPAQPAQAPAAPAQGPVIKDPAEYNAYVGAIGQKDPAAQTSGLEAFLTQYPNSIMKTAALQTLMLDYQQAGNQPKTVDAATRLLAADPTNERALFLLAYIDRLAAQSGGPDAQQKLTDAKKYAQAGLENLPKFAKPEGTSDADFQKMRDEMTGVFNAALGLAALSDHDYDTARKDLSAAINSSPESQKDFTLIYAMTQAYVPPKPPDPKFPLDPIGSAWYNARASVLAPSPQYQQSFEKYAKSQYVRFHGGEDGWNEFLAVAKAGPGPIPTVKPAPTPAEQAHTMAASGDPTQMDFAQWEFILSNGAQPDQDVVWNAIKGKGFKLQGTVIKASPTEVQIAASLDDIDAKQADITLTLETPLTKLHVPKEGTAFTGSEYFTGVPVSYTPNPFMLTMEKGELPKPKTAAPAHHRPKPATN